jgi:hypothetical protein
VLTHLGTWCKDGLCEKRMFFPYLFKRKIHIYPQSGPTIKMYFPPITKSPFYERTFWWVHGLDPPQEEKEIHFEMFDNYFPVDGIKKELYSLSYFAELQVKFKFSNILIFLVDEKEIFGGKETEIITAIFWLGIHEWILNKKGKNLILFASTKKMAVAFGIKL